MPRLRSSARLLSIVSLVAFGAFLVASVWLGRLERGGAPHMDLSLDGEIPATLFLPAVGGGRRQLAVPRCAVSRRAPARGRARARLQLRPREPEPARARAGGRGLRRAHARPARPRGESQPLPGRPGSRRFPGARSRRGGRLPAHLAAGRCLAHRADGALDGRRRRARFCDARRRHRRGRVDLGRLEHARAAARGERALPLRGRRSRAHPHAHRRAGRATRRHRAARSRARPTATSGRARPCAASKFLAPIT